MVRFQILKNHIKGKITLSIHNLKLGNTTDNNIES